MSDGNVEDNVGVGPNSLNDEQMAAQAREMQKAQALMKYSQLELQRAQTINNMRFHLTGAAINGHVSMHGSLVGFCVKDVWEEVTEVVDFIFEEQQRTLEAGSARAEELADKEVNGEVQ